MTSKIVDTFADRRPVSDIGDKRLVQNQEALDYFKNWEVDNKELDKTKQRKRLLSDKLRSDISSMIIGFYKICKLAFARFPGSTISSFRTNSDLVENVFCQERGHNGQNSNPTYAQYGPTMNSILLRQSTHTNCSNTGSVKKLTFFKRDANLQRNESK